MMVSILLGLAVLITWRTHILKKRYTSLAISLRVKQLHHNIVRHRHVINLENTRQEQGDQPVGWLMHELEQTMYESLPYLCTYQNTPDHEELDHEMHTMTALPKY